MDTLSAFDDSPLELISEDDKTRLQVRLDEQVFTIILPSLENEYIRIQVEDISDDFTWLLEMPKNITSLSEYIKVLTDTYWTHSGFELGDDDFMEEEVLSEEVKEELKIREANKVLYSDCVLDPTSYFDIDKSKQILINEYFTLSKKYKPLQIRISLEDYNILQWNLRFYDFDNPALKSDLDELANNGQYNHIHFHIVFDPRYIYPNYPPSIELVRPRLNDDFEFGLQNLHMLNVNYWSPTRTLDYMISKLYMIINRHARVNFCKMSNPTTLLISYVSKLASLHDEHSDHLDDTKYTKYITTPLKSVPSSTSSLSFSSSSSSSTSAVSPIAWKAGTGYLSGQESPWNPSEYLKLCESKNMNIIDLLRKINSHIEREQTEDLYNILSKSYIGKFIIEQIDNILELNTNQCIYQLIFDLTDLLLQRPDGIQFLFESNNGNNIYSTFQKAESHLAIGKDLDPTLSYIRSSINRILSIMNTKKERQNIPSIQSTPNTAEIVYEAVLSPHKFDYVPFSARFDIPGTTTNPPSKSLLTRITREMMTLNAGLPISFSSAIFFRADEDDPRKMKFLITGPPNTPYDSGCFIFDLYTPPEYPNTNPKAHFANNGNFRFNPNLYACGKVCLSLLGTWSKNQWDANTSTLLQVTLSIQSQILVDEPFYNEPGYERQPNDARSKAYNDNIRAYTLRHTIHDLLATPSLYPEFSDIIRLHFLHKRDYIKQLCNTWHDESTSHKSTILALNNKIFALLDSLQ